jgi:hypothetical protein
MLSDVLPRGYDRAAIAWQMPGQMLENAEKHYWVYQLGSPCGTPGDMPQHA